MMYVDEGDKIDVVIGAIRGVEEVVVERISDKGYIWFRSRTGLGVATSKNFMLWIEDAERAKEKDKEDKQ